MIFRKKNQLRLFLWLAVIAGGVAWAGAADAAETADPLAENTENEVKIYSLKIDEPTLARGYTASVFDDNFRVGIFPDVLSEETEVVFKEFAAPENFLPLPNSDEQKLIGSVFEFDIKNQDAFYNEKPVIIEIKYPENSNNLKTIYYWDKGQVEWRSLPTKSIVDRGVVRAPLHLPYARLAIFENRNIMEVGDASWYRYKFCDCAASPDWPKGTKLKVTNLDNQKSVVVKVNDYGPDRSLHPDRAIDLDVSAFKKIASKWLGVIKVKVERVPQ